MRSIKLGQYGGLLKDFFIFALGTALAKVVQLFLMPVYTTYMTTEAYGQADLVNNISELAVPILSLCVYEGVFRYLIGGQESKKSVVSVGIRLAFDAVFLVGAISLLCIPFVGDASFYLLLFIVASRILYNSFLYCVRGMGKSTVFAAGGVVNAICVAVFAVVFVVYLDMAVVGYLAAIGLAFFCTSIALLFLGKIYSEFSLRVEDAHLKHELIRYSCPLVFYNILYFFVTLSGRYILLFFTDASTVGIYSSTVRYTAIINMLQTAVYAAFQLNNAKQFESSGDSDKYFSNVFQAYSAAILIIGSIALCFTPLLADVTLMGEFNVAKYYLPILLYSALIDCLFCFYKSMYTTFKKTGRSIPSILLGALINVALCIALIPVFGIWGVCIANLACNVSMAVYRVYDTRKFVEIRGFKKCIFPLIIVLIQVLILSIDTRYSIAMASVLWLLILAYYFKLYSKVILKKIKG